jgi:hypothetical protein
MNTLDVKKRNLLDFDDFLGKVHDETYEPLSIKNQSSEISPLSGLSEIKRQKAFDYAGYADSVFAKNSKIDVPGGRIEIKKGQIDAISTGNAFSTSGVTFESNSKVKKLKELSINEKEEGYSFSGTDKEFLSPDSISSLEDSLKVSGITNEYLKMFLRIHYFAPTQPYSATFSNYWSKKWGDPFPENRQYGPYADSGTECYLLKYRSNIFNQIPGWVNLNLEIDPNGKGIRVIATKIDESMKDVGISHFYVDMSDPNPKKALGSLCCNLTNSFFPGGGDINWYAQDFKRNLIIWG